MFIMIKVFLAPCYLILFYGSLFFIFSSSHCVKNTLSIMDDLELCSPEEMVKTSKRRKKRFNKKKPNAKFYKHLLLLLAEQMYEWMLKYVPGSNKTEFEVTFTDRKNRKVWKEKDIALFVELDKYLGKVFKRKRCQEKYEEAVKIRFKSNMCKCVKAQFIEKIGEKKIGKCKVVKKYRILWQPPLSVGESSGNDGSDMETTRKSYRNNNKKIDNIANKKISVEKDCKNENVSFKGNHEITHHASMVHENNNKMHSENVYQENNCDYFYSYEDDGRNDLQYNYLAPSAETEMDGNEYMDPTLEELNNLVMDDNEMDENKHKNSEVDLEDLGILYAVDLDKIYYYPNDFDPNVYLNGPNSKIGNNTEFKVAIPNESCQNLQITNAEITNIFIGNSDAYTNPSDFDPNMYLNGPNSKIGNNTEFKVAIPNESCQNIQITNAEKSNIVIGNLDAYANPEYDRSLCQGNKLLENEFGNDILKSDPFLCSTPKGCQKISSSLGETNDWPLIFQALQPVDFEQNMEIGN